MEFGFDIIPCADYMDCDDEVAKHSEALLKTCMALDILNTRSIQRVSYTHYSRDDRSARDRIVQEAAPRAVLFMNKIIQDAGEGDEHYFKFSQGCIIHVVHGQVRTVIELNPK